MKHWLVEEPSDAPPITVIEIPRLLNDGVAISASEVRRRLDKGDFRGILPLVPPATLKMLATKYAPAKVSAA
jgi:[citrate (pro-3S)-lyase] ligase